jgi:hypothetical protein
VVLPGFRALRCPEPSPDDAQSWKGTVENQCAIRYYCSPPSHKHILEARL